MLESILIKNVQKHKKRFIEFDPLCSIFVGRSGLGKSSIIRALIYCLTNQYGGSLDDLLKRGETNLSITTKLDGNSIVRQQGKNGNIYKLNGKEYRAFGRGVPDDISQLINIGEANFSGQHSNVFWFSESPGQVSRNLNSIINLEIIDRTLEGISKKTKTAKSTLRVTKDRLQNAKRKKEELNWVEQVNGELQVVEESCEKLTQIQNKRARIEELVKTGLNYLLRKNSICSLITAVQKEVLEVEEVRERVETLRSKREKLESIIQNYSNIKKERIRLKNELAAAKKDFEEKLGGRCPICGTETEIQL